MEWLIYILIVFMAVFISEWDTDTNMKCFMGVLDVVIIFLLVWVYIGGAIIVPKGELYLDNRVKLEKIALSNEITDSYAIVNLSNDDIIVNNGIIQSKIEYSEINKIDNGAYYEVYKTKWDDNKFPYNIFPTIEPKDKIILYISGNFITLNNDNNLQHELSEIKTQEEM